MAKLTVSLRSSNDFPSWKGKGNAVPIKFSRRIQKKTRLSLYKNCITKKTKRLPVKKRTLVKKRRHAAASLFKKVVKSGIGYQRKSEKNSIQTSHVRRSLRVVAKNKDVAKKNQAESNDKQISKEVLCNFKPSALKRFRRDKSKSFPKIKEENKIGKKSRFIKGSKQISDVGSFLVHLTKKSKTKKKGKAKIQSKRIPKEAAYKLKPSVHKRCKKDISETFNRNKKTRNSLNVSQVSAKKENHTEFTNNKKQSNCKSLKVSQSLLLIKEKGKNKKLNHSKLKSIKVKETAQKKCSLGVTSVSSKSFLTTNTAKITKAFKHSERKKFAKPSNGTISLYTPKSKLFSVTSSAGKVIGTKRHSDNQKSTRSLKHLNQSRILNSGISLNTPAFQSILETPHPQKYPRKKNSPRLLELSPLKTLNKELSTPLFVSEKKHNSLIKKANSSKHAKFPAEANCNEKSGRRKVSNKKITADSCEELKLNQRQLVNKKKRSLENFKMPLPKETENSPIDVLLTPAFISRHTKNQSKKYFSKSNSEPSKRKFHALSTENVLRSNEEQADKKRRKSAGFTSMPVKGTLKHKRWVLNNLKETNVGYEDDIFENQNFNLYKSSFHFGDESDSSSVNIATPKFDCLLTPALAKKTPHFKDCISTTELLQARKSAEEYLHRRNKKKKIGDKLSSSDKKTSVNKKNTTQDLPEKKKLDFEEAVNKLFAVQKDLEKDAEIDDVVGDSYISDSLI